MDKRSFVASVRASGIPEPSRVEWEQLWEIHGRNELYSIAELVEMIGGKKIVDNRRIPQEHKRSALSLEELAQFGKSMAEKFKTGGATCSKKRR